MGGKDVGRLERWVENVEIRMKAGQKHEMPFLIRGPLKSIREDDGDTILTLDIDAIDFFVIPFG